MASVSKMVVDRQKSAEDVLAVGRNHKAVAVEGISTLLDEEAGAAAGVLIDKLIDKLADTATAIEAWNRDALLSVGP